MRMNSKRAGLPPSVMLNRSPAFHVRCFATSRSGDAVRNDCAPKYRGFSGHPDGNVTLARTESLLCERSVASTWSSQGRLVAERNDLEQFESMQCQYLAHVGVDAR
jgi:hypothetical protein